MNYELAKQLKDAGFPQRYGNFQTKDGCVYPRSSKNRAHVPTLEELIGELGEHLYGVRRWVGVKDDDEVDGWQAMDNYHSEEEHCDEIGAFWGRNPEEALASFYLALHNPLTSLARIGNK